MNELRKRMLENKEKEDTELFERIKNNSNPDINDLWALSEDRFIDWRRLHDFPVLLAHFDNTLLLFKEWKEKFKLTNQIIIHTGHLTPFLEAKKLAKMDKQLYLIKQSKDGKERTFVAHGKIEGEKSEFGTTYNYEVLQIFVSYLDWLKKQGKSQEVLYINLRHGKNDIQKVFIHADVYKPNSGFELLKMGGIVAPVNGFGHLYRGKRLEFVNLCGLKFTGQIYFAEEGNLSCSYCACDNWNAESLDLDLVRLEHCSMQDFSLTNSKISNWRFYNCEVSGDFTNSKLYNVQIYGGRFDPIIQNCTFGNTHFVDEPNVDDHNFGAYRVFKKIYQAQGDDDIAKRYFVKENEKIRKRLTGLKFITKSLSYYYWEYGRKPHRIILISLAMIFVFGFVYWCNTDLIALNSSSIQQFGFWDSLYFSTVTFTTLGYGDFSPLGWLRILSSIEAFSGVVNMGFIIAGYANNKY